MSTHIKTLSDTMIRIYDFKKSHAERFIKHPKLSILFDELNNLNQIIAQQKSPESIASNRWKKQEDLVQACATITNLIRFNRKNIPKNHNLDSLIPSTKLLSRLTPSNLIQQAEKLEALFCKSRDLMQAAGITPLMIRQVTLLKKGLILYEQKVVEEREQKEMASQVTLLSTVNRANRIIRHLDEEMHKTFHHDDPEFLKKYLLAREMKFPPHRKMALKGRVLDSVTGKPVTDYYLEIPKANIALPIHNKYGTFQIRNLNPGDYEIHCKYDGYSTIKLNYTHFWGETEFLEIRIQTTEEEQSK